MEIKFNIKPVRAVASSHAEAMKIARGTLSTCWQIGGNSKYHHSCYVTLRSGRNSDEQYLRVFNLEKQRKVVEVLDKPIKITARQATKMRKNGEHVDDSMMITRKVVRPARWIVHTYMIPMSVAEALSLSVIQKNRNFEIKTK